jgi:hypothetical protein
VLLSAFALPLARRRALRRGPRVRIGRLFWMAVVMAAAIILSWEAIVEAVTVLHAGAHAPSIGGALGGHGLWRLPIIAISASIMVLVIATAEALLHLVGVKPTPTPPPIRSALPAEAAPGRDELARAGRGPYTAATRGERR